MTPGADDPDAWVGELEPFLIDSPSQFRSKGPNELTSRGYAKDLREVKRLGSLTIRSRTPDQTTAAIFWHSPPIALWNGQPRHFTSFMGALDEVIDARVWGGIHLRTGDVQGAKFGKQVAHWLDDHHLQPVDCR